jgi:hypothetical protein
MIGGTDFEFWVAEGVSAGDVILHTVARYWPEYVLENALDESPYYKPRTDLGTPQPPSSEFFIYRDEKAAQNWAEHGATPENANEMVHVILGKRVRPTLRERSVTLVVGSRAGEMQAFVSDLSAQFGESIKVSPAESLHRREAI